MDNVTTNCPDCQEPDRRDFLRLVGATALSTALPVWATPKASAAPSPKSAAETAVKALYDTLTDEQKKAICFDWDYKDEKRGLLRTHVSNNWEVTPHHIRGKFYTKKQQDIIHDIFKGLYNPEWYPKVVKQLKDDTGGKEWGAEQSIALFGKPGDSKFQLVMTGRHMTIRADGNTADSVAFGGPIFYGHAPDFNEDANHPGNVYWPQALAANKVYTLLDGKQQAKALQKKSPGESRVGFQGEKGTFPGLPIKEMTADQKAEMQKVLVALLDPYRIEDREEVLECLRKQGGLEACSLAFYEDRDIGKDKVWDNWRLEGPSFVWYFRGAPHVHVWVNIADNPNHTLNARG